MHLRHLIVTVHLIGSFTLCSSASALNPLPPEGSATGTSNESIWFDPTLYPAPDLYRGPTRFPDFKGRDRDYNDFRTRIRDGLKDGPNFAGDISVVQIGCGGGCSFVVVASNRTGKVMSFPRGGEENLYLSLKFQPDSRLMIAQWASQEPDGCFVESFDFDEAVWNEVAKRRVGPADACYEPIDSNLRSGAGSFGEAPK